MRRRRLIALGLLGGALLFAAAGLWRNRLQLVEQAARKWVHGRGGVLDLHIDALGPRRARVTSVEVGGERGLRIRELELKYTPASLLRGRVEALRATGVELAARIDAAGISLGELDMWMSPQDPSRAPPVLPFEVVEVEDLALDLEIAPNSDRDADHYRLGGRIKLSACDTAAPALAADLVIAESKQAARGHLDLEVTKAGPARLAAGLELSRSAALVDQLPFLMDLAPGNAELSWHGEARGFCDSADLTEFLMGRSGEFEGQLRVVLDAKDLGFGAAHWAKARAELSGKLAWRGETLAFDLDLEPQDFDLRSKGEVIATGTHPGAKLFGSIDADTARLGITTSGGHLQLPMATVELDDIALAADWNPREHALPASIAVERVTLSSTQRRPAFPAVGVQGELRPTPERVEFALRARGEQGRVDLQVDGSHRLDASRGSARYQLGPVAFSPGGLQPQDLVPAIGDSVKEVSGALSSRGRLRWGRDRFAPEIELGLEGLSLRSAAANLEGARGTIQLASLSPLRTSEPQSLTFEGLEVGVELGAGALRFTIDPERVAIEHLEAAWSGGRLLATGAFALNDEDQQQLALSLREIDLGSLVTQFADDESLSASGRVGGELPLVIRPDGGLSVRGAQIIADTAGGIIRYQPEQNPPAPPNAEAQWDLVLRALQDFHYHALRVRVDGDLDGELASRIELRGSNPAVENGRPIHLNVNLGGAIGEVIRASLLGTRLPEQIRTRLQERAARGALVPRQDSR